MSQQERKLVILGSMAFAFFGFVLLLSVVHPGAWAGSGPARSPELDLINEAFVAIRENYVTPRDDKEMAFEAIRAMVDGLDPYSAFYDTRQASRFTEETEGAYGGLGVGIFRYRDAITIQYLFPESSLNELGVTAGDRIVAVGGEPIFPLGTDEEMDRIVRSIKGPEGTEVSITIESHETGERREVTVSRVLVDTTSVHGIKMVDDEHGIGYLRLETFQNNSVEDFDRGIEELLSQGMKSLILDLRQNTGGVLRVAVALADRFLDKGLKITSTQGRAPGADRSFYSESEPTVTEEIPLVILMDGRSASASEVLAGAIKDHRRGLLVGTNTYGKGLVQSVLPLGAGEVILKVTSGRYYTPSGRCIHKKIGEDGKEVADSGGIAPDFFVELTRDGMRSYYARRELEKMEDNKVEGSEIFAPDDVDNGVYALRQLVGDFVDPQLEVATKVLRGEEVFASVYDTDLLAEESVEDLEDLEDFEDESSEAPVEESSGSPRDER